MAGSISAKSQLGKLGLKAAKEHSSDIYVYAGPIDETGYQALRAEMLETRRSDNVLLILSTNGGSGSAAFKIARLFQNFYDNFDIFIPAQCKSAGTILALGANRIWMSPFAELGPIDAQIPQPDEIGTVDSSLSTRASLEAVMEASFKFFETSVVSLNTRSQGNISFKLAAEICGSMATNMVSSLVGRIDPALLGRHKRRVEEGVKYGSQLASASGNADEEAVVSLAEDYPCHDFVIDFAQAKTLFRHVQRAEGSLFALGNHLGDAIRHASEGITEIKTLHRTKLPEPRGGVGRGPDGTPFTGMHQANDDRPDQADETSQKAA